MIAAGKFCKRRELARELSEYSKNIFETEKLLQSFEFHQELKRNGVWLTESEVKERVSNTLKHLLITNHIENGLIVDSSVLDYIYQQIA